MKLGTNRPFGEGTQGFINKDHSVIKKEMMVFFLSKATLCHNHSFEQMCLLILNWFLKWEMWPMGFLFFLLHPISFFRVIIFCIFIFLFVALLRKYKQVVQRYFVQYLAGYDSVLLNSLIQVPIQSRIMHKNSKCILIKFW